MTLPDDILRIDTPENVAFGYDVAGIGSRFLAALVDSALIVILQIIVFAALGLLISSLGINLTGESRIVAWAAGLFGLISFGFLWGYYIFFEMLWNGQTPGKRWIGLRVIRTDGTPITLTESFIRNLVRLIDFLPAAYGVGVVAMFVDAQARRLGDLAAGTLVVHDRGPVTLQSLAEGHDPAQIAKAYYPVTTDAAGLPVERLTDQDIQLAEEFLRRRMELANRDALAVQILNNLFIRMGLPLQPMSSLRAEDHLVAIVKASHQLEE